TIETAVEALQRGAFDFLTKPFDKKQLLATMDKARRYHRLMHENRSLRRLVGTRYDFKTLIAISKEMQAVLEQAMAVASTPSTVLITGESGTGKGVLARTIHMNSRVASKPFHATNLACIPEGLFESELFGHKKGAFTGASDNRAGAVETAAGGTLFLDEIGALSKDAQAKLLRLIQEREYSRVGEDKIRKAKARFIAATNEDLLQAVRDGRFREDLYYRLCVIPIELPPLRQRKEDIPGLAALFLDRIARRLERPAPQISQRAFSQLTNYDFPGNVRELENLIERMVILNQQAVIEDPHLPTWPSTPDLAALVFNESPEGIDLGEHEKALIMECLRRTDGNQSKAAKLLGITRSALIYRMEKYGLKNEESP
ncbi:MAG: sigma-54 dependent transcriptional regulator, partial [Planctomycetota bacterium]|nr:sigma-54 dependent transcriptional regulator [Planctomycetota bacterium]